MSKRGRKSRNWPAVYPHKNAAGKVLKYYVDLGLQEVPGEGRKRVRHPYYTLQEAEAKANQFRIARKNEGLSGLVMPNINRVDYERAQTKLAPHGVSLEQVADFYLAHLEMITQEVLLPDVVTELLASKAQRGRSQAYLDDMGVRFNVFARDFAGRPIHEITAAQIEDWLSQFNPANGNNYRRVLSVLFGFAVKRKYALRNPIAQVELATVKPTKPGILTVLEVRALISAAGKDLLPAIVLQLFGGLRPEAEVWRLKWENINLDQRLIDIEASKNTASHRYVTIEPNLAAWLAPYANKTGPVCITEEPYFRRMKEARTAAASKLGEQNQPAPNLTDWPADCLRHCFASYHCGHFRDSRRTSEEMGHSGDLTVFNNHYRNRTKPAEAAAYWAILPASISAFPGSSATRAEPEPVKGAAYRPGSETEAAILANRLSSSGLP